MSIQMYSISDLQDIRKRLVKEFGDASNGEKTSLAFSKHVINRERTASLTKAEVIVVGGTNCIAAAVERKGSEIAIILQEARELPVMTSGEVLFDFLLKMHDPALSTIAFNFAFPLSVEYREDKLDGRLIKPTKEHSFNGLVGECVGEKLEHYIQQQTGAVADVITANDTVCLVLSGLDLDKPENLVAGIVGTGFNFGFYLDDKQVVNLESGNFSNFSMTDSCRHLDRSSNNPGEQLWEKEVAGAYLPHHFNYYNEKLGLGIADLESAEALSQLASTDGNGSHVATRLLKRSASLVACEIAAIYDFKGKETITVVIEGSLFWKGWQHEHAVRSYLDELGLNDQTVRIRSVNNSSIMGAAHLIM